MHGIYELKETLCDELEEYGEKGKLDLGALDIVDKLAHTIKNLDKIIECYEDDSYSREDGGMSYARGRRRDSMGRYSRDNKMMVQELRDLMSQAPDEHTKMEFRKFIDKMEHMG
jgi:hypothetical protein